MMSTHTQTCTYIHVLANVRSFLSIYIKKCISFILTFLQVNLLFAIFADKSLFTNPLTLVVITCIFIYFRHGIRLV